MKEVCFPALYRSLPLLLFSENTVLKPKNERIVFFIGYSYRSYKRLQISKTL